jgi:hypothetical protein
MASNLNSQRKNFHMKKYTTKIAIVALIAVAFASCTSENLNNVDDRDDYTGNWSCQETGSSSGTSSYTVSISKSSTDSSAILIGNFYGLGASKTAIAFVSGNSLTIQQQTVDNLNVLSGSGTLSGNTINLHYSISQGGIDNVDAVYTR